MINIAFMAKTPKADPVAVRFTPEGLAILKAIVAKFGVTQTAVIEMAVREYAERRNIQPAPTTPQPPTEQGGG